MKQNQKGITIVGLLIIVIVIVIISGVCINTGRNILEEAKQTEIEANLLLIQAAGKTLYDKKTLDDSIKLIGTKITADNKPEDINLDIEESDYYILDKDNLEDLGVNIQADELDEERIKTELETKKNVYIINYEKNIATTLNKTYIQVEYIESTGTQYIDIGVIPTANTKVVLELSFHGDFNPSKKTAFMGIVEDNKAFSFNFGGGASQKNAIFFWLDKTSSAGGKIYTLNINDEIRTNKNTLTIESENVSWGDKTLKVAKKTTGHEDTLVLFGRRLNGNIESFGCYNMRVYSCKIYENGILIRDFVPAYLRGVKNIGLYDKINNSFYENKGTETFIKGNDV